ncbi:class I SAM-dependent methyltransferase [Sphingobium sp. BYY-5]|uniref:class I SAM-dependent methyltransferase n=1 Tax=Sphingobium sp. BYY-5 TaxID=2926400 RepID=UPI001FA7D4D2|nr:class I SAM-dependent methyltransferase [Sphingobium sp. BYY-5]MCI4589764.1 class I SAM-dependent methyltransferase [Sphingobium sp. BYY-5]
MERTRLFWMYVERFNISRGDKVLHIAPERGIYQGLRDKLGDGYTTADISPENYAFAEGCRKIDLTDLDHWPSEEYDYIFHIHVMEHIPCNIAYTLFHLHRMLKKTGTHLCIIPFMAGRFDETFEDIGDQERSRRFGQYDHVRKFGRDDVGSHLGKIVSLPDKFDVTQDFSEQALEAANIPPSHWQGLHIGTVLSLKRSDYKLAF